MKDNDEIASLKRKLAAALAENDKEFNDEDIRKIKRLVRALDMFDALGFMSKYAFYALLAAGAILANLDRITEWWKSL